MANIVAAQTRLSALTIKREQSESTSLLCIPYRRCRICYVIASNVDSSYVTGEVLTLLGGETTAG